MAGTEENVYRGVIALVAASEAGMRGRKRTQKAAYFAGVLRATDFSGVRFQYQAFGPYSRQISECLQYLVAAGFVMERENYKEDGEVQYIYDLTPEGRAWVQENSPVDFELLQHIVGVSQETNEKALELAARAKFFHLRGGRGCEIDVKGVATLAGSGWDEFVKEATEVLEALGLKEGQGTKRASLDRPDRESMGNMERD